jgi:hypothetical protein
MRSSVSSETSSESSSSDDTVRATNEKGNRLVMAYKNNKLS